MEQSYTLQMGTDHSLQLYRPVNTEQGQGTVAKWLAHKILNHQKTGHNVIRRKNLMPSLDLPTEKTLSTPISEFSPETDLPYINFFCKSGQIQQKTH